MKATHARMEAFVLTALHTTCVDAEMNSLEWIVKEVSGSQVDCNKRVKNQSLFKMTVKIS